MYLWYGVYGFYTLYTVYVMAGLIVVLHSIECDCVGLCHGRPVVVVVPGLITRYPGTCWC